MKGWLPAVLGIVSGVTTSIVVSRFFMRETTAAPVPAEQSSRINPVADPQKAMDQMRISRLEERLAKMSEAAKEKVENGATEHRPAEEQALERDFPTVEESEAVSRTRHAEAVNGARSQPVDPAWAPTQQAKFQTDLRKLGADVANVECHMTSCLATLQWPSRQAAQAQYIKLVQEKYDPPCDKAIFLEKEEGPPPYRATMIFDCEHERSNPSH